MTANEKYREYVEGGGQLCFKDWITREKKKQFVNFDGQADVPTNRPLTDSINQVLSDIHKEAGLKTGLENKYILGIHRNVWIGVGVAAVITTGIIVYVKTKK